MYSHRNTYQYTDTCTYAHTPTHKHIHTYTHTYKHIGTRIHHTHITWTVPSQGWFTTPSHYSA